MNKLVFALAVVCALACARDCRVAVTESNFDTYTYDLGKLGELTVSDDDKKYTIELCDGVSSGCSSQASVCMTENRKHVSLGKLSTRSAVSVGGDPGQGVVVLFQDGDECTDGEFTSTILLLCDPDQKEPSITVMPDECDYSFQVVTKYGCGTNAAAKSSSQSSGSNPHKKSSDAAGIAILVILIVAVVLYFGIGAFYQYKNNDPATFREYIIHNEFWCSIPGLVVDGCKFIAHGFKKGDYLTV